MNKTKRKFSPEDRLSLLQEAQREGNAETCRKHNLSPSLLGKWKQRYLNQGVAGLKTSYKRVDPEVKRLQQENERLQKVILRQLLQIEVQSELLKKTPIGPRIK